MIVARCPCHGFGIIAFVEALHTLVEVVALDEELRVLAWIDTVAGTTTTEVVVQHVNLAHTGHRHALFATCAPPVEGKSSVQITRCLAVTTANEVSVLVHV